ncbi:hypothetical protein LINPERPRIM_LOCUS9373, partial [Linum perenne]
SSLVKHRLEKTTNQKTQRKTNDVRAPSAELQHQWLLPWQDKTILVIDPGRDLNIHDIPNTIGLSRRVGQVGSSDTSTHRKLEVFGTVISGRKIEELSDELMSHQIIVNREEFMIMYFNLGAPHVYLIYNELPSVSLIRRLNDLFCWYNYGVRPHIETMWDRFQLTSGMLMVDNKGVEKNEKENKRMLEEKDGENQALKEQLEEKEKEIQKLKEQLKVKDGQILKQFEEKQMEM